MDDKTTQVEWKDMRKTHEIQESKRFVAVFELICMPHATR